MLCIYVPVHVTCTARVLGYPNVRDWICSSAALYADRLPAKLSRMHRVLLSMWETVLAPSVDPWNCDTSFWQLVLLGNYKHFCPLPQKMWKIPPDLYSNGRGYESEGPPLELLHAVCPAAIGTDLHLEISFHDLCRLKGWAFLGLPLVKKVAE